MKAILSFLFPSWTYKDAAIELESLDRRDISLDQVLTMEKQIAAFRAEQIDILARKIIASILTQLDIDIQFGALEEKPNPERKYPIYHILPTVNGNGDKLATLLPSVEDQIEEAVSTPQQYTYNNETFSVSSEEDAQMVNEWLQAPRVKTEPRIGTVLSEVLLPFAKKRIAEAVSTPFSFITGGIHFPLLDKDQRDLLGWSPLRRSMGLTPSNESAGLTLSVNLDSRETLRFNIKKYIDRQTTLIDAGTMDEFKLHVELGVV